MCPPAYHFWVSVLEKHSACAHRDIRNVDDRKNIETAYSGLNSVPSNIHVHLEPQSMTSFGINAFTEVNQGQNGDEIIVDLVGA